MNIRNRVIGPCLAESPDPEAVVLDIDSFLRRLLLFETYILQSVHLREMPRLNATFGAAGVRELIEAGAIRFQCDALSIGNSSHADGVELPPGTFNLVVVRASNVEQLVTTALQNAHENAKLKDAIRLKNAILDALDQPPPGFGVASLKDTYADLRSDALLRAMIAASANKLQPDNSVAAERLEAQVTRLAGESFRIESNLGELLRLDPSAVHSILEQAALGIVDMNYRIEEMRTFNALSGALGEEAVLFGQKLAFIARGINPDIDEQRLGRVLEIRGFPSLTDSQTRISADRLLKVRDSTECLEFRAWLQSIDRLSDDDVRDRVAGLRARVDIAYQSEPGKILRFLATSALGFIPGGLGLALSTGAGILDTFVLDKLLSASGPALFLNRSYPSIFRKPSRATSDE